MTGFKSTLIEFARSIEIILIILPSKLIVELFQERLAFSWLIGFQLEYYAISSVSYIFKARERRRCQGGTLFGDHLSCKVFNFFKFSTGAAETVESKHTLEHFGRDKGLNIKSYHSDNDIF